MIKFKPMGIHPRSRLDEIIIYLITTECDRHRLNDGGFRSTCGIHVNFIHRPLWYFLKQNSNNSIRTITVLRIHISVLKRFVTSHTQCYNIALLTSTFADAIMSFLFKKNTIQAIVGFTTHLQQLFWWNLFKRTCWGINFCSECYRKMGIISGWYLYDYITNAT